MRFVQKKNLFLLLPVLIFLFFGFIASAQQTLTEIGGYKLIVPLPGIAGEAAPTNLAEFIRFVYLWLMGVVGLAAGIMVIVGGVRYLLSAGNPSKAQDARENISRALLGFVVVLASYLILNTINPSLVNFSASGVAPLNDTISNTYLPPNSAAQEGQCFKTDSSFEGLGGTDCTALGNGWQPSSLGCNNTCGSGQICCVCNAGSECGSLENSCALVDAETLAVVEGLPDPILCGPYVSQNCLNRCPANYTCVRSDQCGNPVSQDMTFEITYPFPPREGNTVTPVEENQPITISVRAPESLSFVEISVRDPNGIPVPIGTNQVYAICTPSGGACAVMWNDGVTVSGNYRISAVGKDENGNVVSGMNDEVRICGFCGPTVSFTATKTGCSGTAAQVTLDGSASRGSGASQLSVFEWTETDANGVPNPIFTGKQPAPIVTVAMEPGTHTIELRVTDEYGSSGSAEQTVTFTCP